MDPREMKSPEVPSTPEQKPETILPSKKEKPPAKEPSVEAPQSIILPVPLPPVKKPEPPPQLKKDIESIMEEGLSELYIKLPSALQGEFKIKGEETSNKIVQIFARGKEVAKKIFEAIVEWLKLIPGVNKFFLEQEAKIKTDKIMNLKK